VLTLLCSTQKSGKARKDFPWGERYCSINTENRFRLHFQVIFLRMIENVFVCVYLPQTSFACRVTGHCTPGAGVWDRRWVLNGGERFGSSSVVYDSLPLDKVSSVVIGLSVAMITALILLAQVVILDKSNLASSGLKHAVKQEHLSAHPNDSVKARPSAAAGAAAKRKGKGKITELSLSSSAASASSDTYLRAGHDMFQFELGHHATSTIIIHLTNVILFQVAVILFVCLIRFWSHVNFVALCVALFACVVASYVVPWSGLSDIQELEHLADNLRDFNDKKERAVKIKSREYSYL
jgi:hypothetical protein